MGLCKFTRFFANVQLYICALAKRHADVNAECGNYSKELRGLRVLRGFRDFRDLRDLR